MKTMSLSIIHGEKCWPSMDKISPCEESCPIHTDIPSYIIAISQGMVKEALEVIRDTNPLPSVCGRICHRPCEESCNRRLIDAALAIRSLKRFVMDYSSSNSKEYIKPFNIKRLEKIVVIGSGPAGLTAAYNLVKWGYPVVVYESMTTPGGILTKCIPEFLLPKNVVEKDIEYLINKGVKIKTSTTLGREISLDDLKKKGFMAILLATGSQQSIDLNLEGRWLQGIEVAVDFLARVKNGYKPNEVGRFLVIGGGNVAMSVARVARRLGYQEVHLACLERSEEMPAFRWEVEAAEAEGVRFHYRLSPKKFLGNRRVTRVEFKRVEKFFREADGKLSWTLAEGSGSEYGLEVDRVVIAIGQMPGLEYLQGADINLQNGRQRFEEKTLTTSTPGIFVAGDIINPQGTVIEAIRDGYLAARAIAKYLDGREPAEPRNFLRKESYVIDKKKLPILIPVRQAWDMPKLPTKTRVRSQEEVELGYRAFEAIQEANRCLNCRMCGSCIVEKNQICYQQSTRLL